MAPKRLWSRVLNRDYVDVIISSRLPLVVR